MALAKLRGILATIFLCLILAASPIFFGGIESILPTVAQQGQTIVVDPSSVQSQPVSPEAFAALSGQIIDFSSSGKFQNASRLVALANIISGNLAAEINVYLNLLANTNTHLKAARTYLNQTSALIDEGNLTSASARLNMANDELNQTKTNVNTLNLILSRANEVYGIDVTSQREKLSGLTSLVRNYEKRAGNLQSRITSEDKREQTVLQMHTLENTVLVNQSFFLIGSLQNGKGEPLPGREIQILLNETSVELSTRTSDNGTFQAALTIRPALHLTRAELRGKFEPTGNDQVTYRSSESPPVTVDITYLQTQLLVSPLAPKARVSDPFSIQGKLLDSSNSPLQGKMVDLSVDNTTVDQLATDPNGNFDFEYSFEPGTVTGVHIIRVTFTPENDLFVMQTETFPIQVFYYQTSLSTNHPTGPVFSGQTIVVSGIVTSPNATENGTVQAFANGKLLSTVQVSDSGEFQVPITVPLDVSNDVVITLAFLPLTPWLQGSTETLQLPVTNSIAIALTCAAMGLIGLAVYKTPQSMLSPVTTMLRRLKREKEEKENSIESPAERHPAKPEALALDLSAIRVNAASPNQLVKAVYRAVRGLLSSAFNVATEPTLTHWEFLEKTRPLLKDSSKYLEELSRSFESVEYAEQKISAAEAEKAVNNSIVLTETVGGKVLT